MAEVQQDEEKDKIPEVISFIMAKKNEMAKYTHSQNVTDIFLQFFKYIQLCFSLSLCQNIGDKHWRVLVSKQQKNHICIWQFFHICKSDFALSSFAIIK